MVCIIMFAIKGLEVTSKKPTFAPGTPGGPFSPLPGGPSSPRSP